jgi:pyruvate/2-oxoglutarate dehydrogenase complex dihydrolipoamide acyltransferase (E2) component
MIGSKTIELALPRVGMNMEEATIARWTKQPGEYFAAGEALYEIETDKVTQQIEAPFDGRLLEQRIAAGSVAQVGQTVCVAETSIFG